MIKLIATDLDGTLLDPKGNLPIEIFPLIRRLFERGVIFVPASGRQIDNLEKTFAPVLEQCAFIAENGALVKYKGKTVYLDPLPKEKAKAAIDVIRALDGLYPIVCTEKVAYIENDVEPFFSRTTTPYASYKLVPDLKRVLDETPCCKISVFCERPAKDCSVPILTKALQGVRVILSGNHWCDVSSVTAHKGAALKALQQTLGISREECLAFGDQMNDVEMLRAAAHTAAPKNAYPPVKAQVEKIIPSNANGGVLKAISAMLENPKGVWLWTKNLS